MTPYEFFITPFADYGFMRRALVACAAMALGGAPLGVFLVLRRMTLMGDAISHAILPGVALAYMCFGLSLPAMTLGGLAAGLCIALVAGAIAKVTQLKEDASFTGIYLLSLAAGVLMISMRGGSVDVMHVLFGNVLFISDTTLLLMCSITTLSALALAALYRSLVMECFDSGFLGSVGAGAFWINLAFLALVVMNLVAAFAALGTLMALSIMVLPAIAARFWATGVEGMLLISMGGALVSGAAGLLLSYHCNLPSGPAIVLCAGAGYVFSVALGRHGSIASHFQRRKHFVS